MKRGKGFTLIELLVVVAIIALLLSILLPALGRAREIAQRVVCGTSLRGIHMAMVTYASGHQDRFPVAGSSESTRFGFQSSEATTGRSLSSAIATAGVVMPGG